MNTEGKATIKTIVQMHPDGVDNSFRAEFIHGKGKGQIILLHGPPGTGTYVQINHHLPWMLTATLAKTSTAGKHLIKPN